MENASIRNYQDRNFQTVNYKIGGCSLPQIYQDGEFLNNEKTTDTVKLLIENCVSFGLSVGSISLHAVLISLPLNLSAKFFKPMLCIISCVMIFRKMYELDMVSSSCILMVPSMTQEAAALISLGWGIPKQAQYHAGEFPYQRYINIGIPRQQKYHTGEFPDSSNMVMGNSQMATISCWGIPRWQQHIAGEFPDSHNMMTGNSLTVTIW
ncbi:hypothetical protein BS17DRAFT_769469 [Gyrodon lividus]|nr:hypothetical protein BS17DRAFT_769469 [Gyrodon lividus]